MKLGREGLILKSSRRNKVPNKKNKSGKKKNKQSRPTIKGHGDYSVQPGFKDLARGIGRSVGEAIGAHFGPVGKVVGGYAGHLAGAGISKLTGHGDYSVRMNSLTRSGTANKEQLAAYRSNWEAQSSFRSNGKGVRLCHREFIGDIVGTTGFSINSYAVNPAMAETFPYLSQIAKLFDEYHFEGLVFEYVPTSGMISGTSAALGTVVMSTVYDSYLPTFTTKQQMESYEFAVSTVPYGQAMHPVECARDRGNNRVLYTRTGAYQGSILDYDLGKFEIATVGMPSVYTVGELWVTYDVRLLKPRLQPGIAKSATMVLGGTVTQSTSPSWLQANWGLGLLQITRNSISVQHPIYNMSAGGAGFAGQPFGCSPTSPGLYFTQQGTYRVTVTSSTTTAAIDFSLGPVTNFTGHSYKQPAIGASWAIGSNVAVTDFSPYGNVAGLIQQGAPGAILDGSGDLIWTTNCIWADMLVKVSDAINFSSPSSNLLQLNCGTMAFYNNTTFLATTNAGINLQIMITEWE